MPPKKTPKPDEAPAAGPSASGETPPVSPDVRPPAPCPVDIPEAKVIPRSVTLAAPHGFIDGDGLNRHWPIGTVVTDEDEIALLVSRMAPLTDIIYED